MTRRRLPLDRLGGLRPADRGLTDAEARDQRARHGPNDIVEIPRRPWWDVVRETVRDPMIWFLIGTGAVYALVGERLEALTLLAAIAPLVGMDAILHRRTQASTEGLKSRLAARATVIRDGAPLAIAALDVVPGDLAIVPTGDAFPADGIVVGGSELQVDESTLTGESYPVRKRPLPEPVEDGAEPMIEAEHWGFAGTRLLTGEASLRVVYTGGETFYGEIVRSATRGPQARTPLQQSIANLVSALIVVASVVCVILAFVRVRQGHGWVDALVSAVTLAVAALPEEFPVVFTFFLGVGVYRLARRQALVRRAVSVENIGRVSAICADKTGTITEGRLRLTHLVPAAGVTERELLALARIAAREETGDPLDTAIAHAAAEAGVPRAVTCLASFPFTEDRRRETTVARDQHGQLLAVTKGTTELVLAMTGLAEHERGAWSRRTSELAAEGHKMIACAWRPLPTDTWPGGEPDHGFRLAGALAFEDPVRPGVAEAVRACREADIHVTMVTGDHPLTARAVAREIGLGDTEPIVISGDEMEARLSAGAGSSLRAGAASSLRNVDVIARAVPAQKLALVRALQEAGEIVAVTGDGVNDVPALQAADVGIAMGERGTRSAREVAPIVLLDDNFRTIVGAIREGRQLFRNLQLSFQYLLMIHLPLVVTAALVPLAGYPLLYLPVHIVWLELVIHPTALLVFQEVPAGAALARVRRGRARFFSAREWLTIATIGGLITLLVTWGFASSLGAGRDVEHGRAMALMGLTWASVAMTIVLSGLRTWTARLVSAATAGLSLTLVQTPALARWLHLAPLHLDDLVTAVVGSVAAVSLPLAVLGGRTGTPHAWRRKEG